MKPANITELQEMIRSQPRLSPGGNGSKTALRPPGNGIRVELSGLAGLLEYQPSEYTFTALAGTPVRDIGQVLDHHGQFLPFDPPLAEHGATLGGTVAAGLSGPGRYRFGGVRDFLLAIQYLDGEGQLVRAGGKVVKNSAGFDLPKWMVGSLGGYGALVELTFKVFPGPRAYISLRAGYPSLEQALQALIRLAKLPIDLFCLDLIPNPGGADLFLRIGGLPEAFPGRIQRVRDLLDRGEVVEGEPEATIWRDAREFNWLPPGNSLVKVPITPARVLQLDRFLTDQDAIRRYSVGANLAWIGWSGELSGLDEGLSQLQLSGLVILGPPGRPYLGERKGMAFAKRVKQALDPQARWVEIEK
jgi:glycolate oxidase FAD binding subunit